MNIFALGSPTSPHTPPMRAREEFSSAINKERKNSIKSNQSAENEERKKEISLNCNNDATEIARSAINVGVGEGKLRFPIDEREWIWKTI